MPLCLLFCAASGQHMQSRPPCCWRYRWRRRGKQPYMAPVCAHSACAAFFFFFFFSAPPPRPFAFFFIHRKECLQIAMAARGKKKQMPQCVVVSKECRRCGGGGGGGACVRARARARRPAAAQPRAAAPLLDSLCLLGHIGNGGFHLARRATVAGFSLALPIRPRLLRSGISSANLPAQRPARFWRKIARRAMQSLGRWRRCRLPRYEDARSWARGK